MAILNAWQRIDRVITGKPWGDGTDGSTTISSDPNTRATITGTATENTGTAGSSDFANGDLVLLHQTQGTGAGQWEVNKVASGGGSTSLTFQVAHHYTYSTGAQIIKVPRYSTTTVSAHSVTAWNGTTGGVEVICGKTSVTLSGQLSVAGATGVVGNSAGTNSGGGFRGGAQAGPSPTAFAYRGEGISGGLTQATAALANAGGGGQELGTERGQGVSGGGGGHATAGSNGTTTSGGSGSHQIGIGGETTADSADLIIINMGGGAGGGAQDNNDASSGGSGGGILMIITKSFVGTGQTLTANGGAGGASTIGGAGGAGGSILLVCDTATIETCTATGGAGYDGGQTDGGTGGTGRIAVHHSGTVTGTTTPTFEDVTDSTLKEATAGYSFFL